MRVYIEPQGKVTRNPYNAEILLHKPWRPKGFFNFKLS